MALQLKNVPALGRAWIWTMDSTSRLCTTDISANPALLSPDACTSSNRLGFAETSATNRAALSSPRGSLGHILKNPPSKAFDHELPEFFIGQFRVDSQTPSPPSALARSFLESQVNHTGRPVFLQPRPWIARLVGLSQAVRDRVSPQHRPDDLPG
jgi:hypothetical protein